MKVEVTQDDIDRGEQKDNYSCAFALALSRVPNMKRVYVASKVAFLTTHDENKLTLPLIDEVCKWILNFDRDKGSVHPITFEIDLARAEKIIPGSY